MRGPLGALTRGFNRLFDHLTQGYIRVVRLAIRLSIIMIVCLCVIMAGTGGLVRLLPTGFVPSEDQGYFFATFTLPDGAALERTDAVMQRAEAFLKQVEGVQGVVTLGGLSLLTNTYTSNTASLVMTLQPWHERHSRATSLAALMARVQQEFTRYPEAIAIVFSPPPIPGLGISGDSSLRFRIGQARGRTSSHVWRTNSWRKPGNVRN